MHTDAKEKELRATLCLVLLAVTVVVYWQVCGQDFVNYDDGGFVTGNPHSYTGLTLDNLKWDFTTLNGDTSYYHPLTWLSYQVDCQIFGVNAGAVHLTNLLLHLANTGFLLLALHKMTGLLWRSAAVAALFALHPLHVETVCWVSERKSLVCTLFWMLTLLAYVRYTRRRNVWSYFLVLVAFAGSLMGKPMAVTLPFVLLLLDFWPLGRLSITAGTPEVLDASGCVSAEAAHDAASNSQALSPGASRSVPVHLKRRFSPRWRRVSSLIAEKIPLLGVAAVVSWVTVLAQQDVGAMASLRSISMKMRLENSIVAYVLYLRKMLWPADLAPIYPYETHWAWWQVGGCLWFLCGMTLLAVRTVRKRPYFLTGWLWFIGTLVPMIGIVQVGSQGMADRYTYVTMTGIFVAIVWAAGDLLAAFPRSRAWIAGVSVGVVAACAFASAVQASYWKTSIRLFDHAVRVTGRNPIAYATLGFAFSNQGNNPEARRYVNDSLAIAPGQARLHGFLGRLSFGDGDIGQALRDYDFALRIDPNQEEAHALLALVYKNRDFPTLVDFKKAVAEARRTCELTRFRQRKYILFLSRICLETEDYEEALAMAGKALDMSVSPGEIYEARIVLKAATERESAKRSKQKPSNGGVASAVTKTKGPL